MNTLWILGYVLVAVIFKFGMIYFNSTNENTYNHFNEYESAGFTIFWPFTIFLIIMLLSFVGITKGFNYITELIYGSIKKLFKNDEFISIDKKYMKGLK